MAPFVLDALAHPIVQAPMGGGPSTPALAAAVSGAGGLGFLAAGYKTPGAVRADLEELRSLLPPGVPFGLNVFAPPGHGVGAAQVPAYAARLRSEAERSAAALGEARWDDDHYADKLALVCAERVPVVSFTFGCPEAGDVERLRDAGAEVWMTATTPDEARVARAAGGDAVVVQGVEAGGHHGGFDDAAPGDLGARGAPRCASRPSRAGPSGSSPRRPWRGPRPARPRHRRPAPGRRRSR
jgi:nitronate monooxygenase